MDSGDWHSPVMWCVSVGLELAAFKSTCYHCTAEKDADMESASLSQKDVTAKHWRLKDNEKINVQSCVIILFCYDASLTVKATR